MNTTGCPPGWATDRMFQVGPPETCESSMIFYWTTVAVIVLLKIFSFVARVRHWIARYRLGTAAGWLPLAPMVSLLSLFGISLTLFLAGFNVINVYNGITFSLFSIGFLATSVDYVMMLLKIVRLGRRVIPTATVPEEASKSLQTLNKVGIFLLVTEFIAMSSTSVVLIVMSPIYPHTVLTLAIAGFSLKSVFLIFSSTGIFYQYQRVIDAIHSYDDYLKVEAPQLLAKNKVAIRNLRKRQFSPTFIFTAYAGLIYILFAANVVPWTWEWMAFSTAGLESVGTFFQDVIFAKRPNAGKNKQQLVVRTSSAINDIQPAANGGGDGSNGKVVNVVAVAAASEEN